MGSTPEDPLVGRLADVRGRIARAARRGGRSADAVQLVLVTKAVEASIFARARAAGVVDVGESRVQSAAARARGHEQHFRWHLVGHLQTNKVRRALATFDVFHGIDSLRLMERIESVAAETGRRPELLLQVNVSGEAAKSGFTPAELGPAVERAQALQAARVVGLMTMAPLVHDPEQARPVFRSLARLRDELATPADLPHLSMGMSADFEVAVEEGATMVRIGRRLVADLPG